MVAFSRQAPKRPEQIGMYGAEVGSEEAAANRSSGYCTVDAAAAAVATEAPCEGDVPQGQE
eukprot:9558426-Prorocentrum_lima.AAC.1